MTTTYLKSRSLRCSLGVAAIAVVAVPALAQSPQMRMQAQPLFSNGYESNWNRRPSAQQQGRPNVPTPAALPQNDQQLQNAARLFEQQGRHAQAQRIYAELNRRYGSENYAPRGSMPSLPPVMPAPQMMPAQQTLPQPVATIPQRTVPTVAEPTALSVPSTPNPPLSVPSLSVPSLSVPPTTAQTTTAPPITLTSATTESGTVTTITTTAPAASVQTLPTGEWRRSVNPLPAALAPIQPAPAKSPEISRETSTSSGPTKLEPVPPAADFLPPKIGGSEMVITAPPAVPAAAAPITKSAAHVQDAPAPPVSSPPLASPVIPRAESFHDVRNLADELAKQTDEIRIIPATRGSLGLRPADVPPPEKKPTPHASPATVAVPANEPPQPTTAPKETPAAAAPAQPDLSALLGTAEFREMHVPAVLEGLQKLTSANPADRAAAASQIGSAGRDARTALPVLRAGLRAEPAPEVRLRLAETILKVQPNDDDATACLAELMRTHRDWQVRQSVADALAAASAGSNAKAVEQLRNALDDSHPKVRSMAALSLGQFGAAAFPARPRLEEAINNDIPPVQQNARAALSCITGGGDRAQLVKPRSDVLNGLDTAPASATSVTSAQSAPLPFSPVSSPAGLPGEPTIVRVKSSPAATEALQSAITAATRAADQTAEPLPAEKPAAQPTAPVIEQLSAEAPNGLRRPLRLEPSQHPHVPGQRSQKRTAAAPAPFILEAGEARELPKP